MTNAYCDLATLKSEGGLNVSGSHYDCRLLALLEEGSRWIDDYCNRHFYVLETARQFEVNFGSYQSGGWRQLLVPDLVAVSSLRTWHIPPGAAAPATGPAWDAADYRLYPRDAGPTRAWGRPYTRVAVNGDAPAVRGRRPGRLPWKSPAAGVSGRLRRAAEQP